MAAVAVALTRVDAAPGAAQVRAESASGAVELASSANGDAVLRAGDLQPGGRTVGTVAVRNTGDATGAFRLTQTDVLDTPGTGGGRLSSALRLRVDDATSRRAIYQGRLGAMPERPLGYLRSGQRAAYRFTVSFPGRAPADRFAGSRVETTFAWTATTAEPPAPDRSRDRTPPVVVAQLVRVRGRSVIVALTCSERCRIVGLSRGAELGPRQPLVPGRPALQSVRSAGDALPLRVTVADAQGNRTTTVARRRSPDP